MTAGTETPSAIALDDDEQELVLLEVEQLLPALRGERLERYEALADAAEEGVIPPELQPQLESLLSMALQTARIRTLYTAEGERILTRLYERTPAGRELADHLASVNAALRSVAGARLETAKVRMRTLGHFTVMLDTDAAQITLAVRPEGVTVDSVAVGDKGRGGS